MNMSRHSRTRRSFIKSARLLFPPLLFPTTLSLNPGARELILYVGTYTTGKSEGIYIYRLNLSTGELRHKSTVTGVVNPSFLAIDPQRRHLFAVNETTEFNGKRGGAVTAFSIDQATGGLTLLNQQPSLGEAPCYVEVDRTGKFILVANYGGGNVSVLPVGRDGRLSEATALVQHQGSGPNSERQEGPHAHCITVDRTNRYA